jgi:serine phosphatase RsbU (regulator of sigma subunit)
MEAYCSGVKSSNPELTHTVTDEDRNKLERQRIIQMKLPAKHESAINVLRAKQERDIKVKLQKQDAELQSLDEQYEKDRKTEELQYVQESSRLDALIQRRRERMIHRWDLKVEIWRKDWESQHGTMLNGRLPHGDWPESPDMEAPISPSSSLAIYTQVVA